MTDSKVTSSDDWTQAQIDAIEAAYEKCPKGEKLNNDDVIALEKTPVFENKNVHKIRGKVVSLGYYKAAKKVAVGSGGVVTKRKMEYVRAIETLTSMKKGSLASFEKASKPQLEALNEALIALSEQVNLASK